MGKIMREISWYVAAVGLTTTAVLGGAYFISKMLADDFAKEQKYRESFRGMKVDNTDKKQYNRQGPVYALGEGALVVQHQRFLETEELEENVSMSEVLE